VLAADEVAERHAERCCNGREVALVDGLAGLEATDGAYIDAGKLGEIVDAEAACDAKAESARRQELNRFDDSVAVPADAAARRSRLVRRHRFASMHQYAASVA